MVPDQLRPIKQNLNKAYRLFKPTAVAAEEFKRNLILLLGKLSGEESEVPVTAYLGAMLQDTYLDFEYEEPQNSSPVCFATVSGLREGFENPFLTEVETPVNLNNSLSSSTQLPNKKAANPNLKEALQLTKSVVREIILAKLANSQTDTTALEKQIKELVYQLYELTLEEIRLVDSSD